MKEPKDQQAALDHANKRLRALTQRLIKLQEAERRALAADLHDYAGQKLSALSIDLAMLDARMPQKSPEQAAIFEDARGLTIGIGRAIWQLITDLRAEIPAAENLLSALHRNAETFAKRNGIETIVTGSHERLPGEVESALLRVALEALSNVAKHAEARHVDINLRIKHGRAALWIADDGIGYDPAILANPGKRSRWGLMMMRERIESLGGRLRILTRPGRGTRIYATLRGSA